MTDTPEKRAERAWRTIWRDANGHIADSFPYKPEEDDVILPEIRSAVAEAREDERGMVFDAVLEAMISVLKIESPFDQQRLRDEIRKGLRALAGEEEK